jgi:hypothetical protein
VYIRPTSNRIGQLSRIKHGKNNWIFCSLLIKINRKFEDVKFRNAVKEVWVDHISLQFKIGEGDDIGFHDHQKDNDALAHVCDTRYASLRDLEEICPSATKVVADAMCVDGASFRVIAFLPKAADADHYLICMLFNHAACDMWGREIVEHDVRSILHGEKAPLECRRFDYRTYVDAYYSAHNDSLDENFSYWKQMHEGIESVSWRESGHDLPEMSTTVEVSRQIENFESSTLGIDAFVAMSRAFCRWSNMERCSVGIVYHNRAPFKGFRGSYFTVGWLSEIVPIIVDLSVSASESHSRIVEQIERLNVYGSSYGFLKYLTKRGDVEAWANNIPELDVCINVKEWKSNLGHRGSPSDSIYPLSDFDRDMTRPVTLSGGVVRRKEKILASWEASPLSLPSEDIANLLDLSFEELRRYSSEVTQ